MKSMRFGALVAVFVCKVITIPTTGWTETPTPEVTDIALQPGGLLVGQVLNREGVAQIAQPVVVMYGDHVIVRTSTDKNGVFAAAGLRGGQYQIVTTHKLNSVRAWAPETAPPSAKDASLVIVGDEVVRGQFAAMPGSLIQWCRTHPWLCTITAITAVGVPLVIAEGDDNS